MSNRNPGFAPAKAFATLVVLGALGALAGCGNGGSGGGGGSGGSGGSGAIDAACAHFAGVACAKAVECTPPAGVWVGGYCETRMQALCKMYYGPGGADAPAADIEACAAASQARACDATTPLAACQFHGPRAAGAACSQGLQCQSGGCRRSAPDETCGTCTAKTPAAGDPCGADPGVCAPGGLACSAATSKCTPFGQLGDACDPSVPCWLGLRCDAGKCAPRLPEGATCDPAQFTCVRGTSCNAQTKKCEAEVVAHAGEPCGPDPATGKFGVCTLDTSCSSTPGGSALTCRIPAKEGEACTGLLANCEFGALCIDGACKTAIATCQ